MERDFLGIGGKDVREEARDSAFIAASAVQWPFSNKISSLQQFMSYKAAQAERPKKVVLHHFTQPFLSLDSFEAKSTTGVAPQERFSLDKQGAHQFGLNSYHSLNGDSFDASKHQGNETRTCPMFSYHSIPVLASSPFFKVHGAPNDSNLTATLKQQSFVGGVTSVKNPNVGVLGPRDMSKPPPTTAQLMIFYAGSVNVYNDVPLDKAQAIISMASSGSVASSTVNPIPRSDAPVLAPDKVTVIEGRNGSQTQTQILNNMASHCRALSSPISVTSRGGPHSDSSSSFADDVAGTKAAGTLTTASQNGTSKTITTSSAPTPTVPIMPGAVPQARKASLVRFLEKRKERVSNAAPYSYTKKPTEGHIELEDNNLCSKTLSPNISLSSCNMEQSWILSQAKNTTDTAESLSTKLEI